MVIKEQIFKTDPTFGTVYTFYNYKICVLLFDIQYFK